MGEWSQKKKEEKKAREVAVDEEVAVNEGPSKKDPVPKKKPRKVSEVERQESLKFIQLVDKPKTPLHARIPPPRKSRR